MTQPAHVTLSSSIAREYHDTIRTFVALGAALVNTDLSECEVHVKQGLAPCTRAIGLAQLHDGYGILLVPRHRQR
jgi:hypothetical protein